MPFTIPGIYAVAPQIICPLCMQELQLDLILTYELPNRLTWLVGKEGLSVVKRHFDMINPSPEEFQKIYRAPCAMLLPLAMRRAWGLFWA